MGWDVSAHPRWRGAHSFWPAWPYIWWGSSPLARGTCSIVRSLPVDDRLIPAGAGHITPTVGLAIDGRLIPAGAGHITRPRDWHQ